MTKPNPKYKKPPYHPDCRFLVSFREFGGQSWYTDCAFPTRRQANQYVRLIVSNAPDISEGRVFDQETGKIVYYYAW